MRHRAHSRSRSPPRRDGLALDSFNDKDKHAGYIEISCNSCNSPNCRSARQFLCRAIGSFIVCLVLFIGYLAFDEYRIILKQRAARLKYFSTHPRPKSYKPVNCLPNSNASASERYYNGLSFIHVPKCGGTSIREMIYGVAMSCRFINFVHEGREKWKQISETRRVNAKVYGGLNHLSYYELAQTWPGTHMDTAAFFTQLRNPWERLNSHYHYAKSMGSLHALGEETENTPFEEWSKTMSDGYMLSFFVEHNFTEVGGHELRRCCFNQKDLENAKALLRRKFIVGLVEEPQKTIDLLRCRVSWVHKAMDANPRLGKSVHVNKGYAYNISDAEDAAIRSQFPLDFQFYEYGIDLFDEQYNDCVARGLILSNNTSSR